MLDEHDGLAGAPLMFIFLDVSSLPRHRRLYEDVLQLRVVESQFHPPHEHHGLVKYDAGGTILAVNLFADRKFRSPGSDAVTLVLRHTGRDLDRLVEYGQCTDDRFTDTDGHHYLLRPESPPDPALTTDISELHLDVPDLSAALEFYRDVLRLSLLATGPRRLHFGTGSIDLVVHAAQRAADEQPVRHNACLMVFYTGDVMAAASRLRRRGLRFTSSGFSDIGGTARFRDPSGHTFCLYQPSAVSLAWGSGGKVRDLMTGGAVRHRPSGAA